MAGLRGAWGGVAKLVFRTREVRVSRIPSVEQAVAVIKIGGSILKDARAYRRAAVFVRNRRTGRRRRRSWLWWCPRSRG